MTDVRAVGVVSLLLLLLATACGTTTSTPAKDSDDERPATFAEPEITWAQGTRLHYGDRTFTVPGDVRQLWRTPYGFLVALRPTKDYVTRSGLVFFDGRTSTAVEGEPAHVKVSPDGRYAGWMDFHGPKRVMGRLAVVTVMDLRTGEQVFSNHDDMGGVTDDLADLYEDAEVDFLGFDTKYAYWNVPAGKTQRHRAAIGSWKVEPASRKVGIEDVPVGQPHDSLAGTPAVETPQGSLIPTRDGLTGFRSPSTRWCVTDGQPGRLFVDDCRTGKDATPAYPTRSVGFGGWQGDDTIYVLSRTNYRFDGDPGTPDHSTGVIASCSLLRGSCHTVERVRRTESVVFGSGLEPMTG